MYQYTEFDQSFVRSRAAQFRDQLERWQSGKLSEDDFRPLRLQNGWYVQRHAPMLRVAVPYGELSSAQLRMLARIAREYDEPEAEVYRLASEAQRKLGTTRLPTHYAHFTTRTNVQFNWIPLSKAADVMDLLASVDMHGIQTSGNCIRNISCDERAGVAPDEIADPRPFAEIMRQWTTLHPEFAFLPRKFKIAITGATEDRAATDWHDVGLQLLKNDAGELGFRVTVGGGMGRTPVIGTVLREFLPWHQIMNYIEAVVRVYNRYGRRDNKYKARIKILVKAEGQRYIDEVEEEFRQIVEHDGGPHTIPQAELDRVSACFVPPRRCIRGYAERRTAIATSDAVARADGILASTAGCSAMWRRTRNQRLRDSHAVVQTPAASARRRIGRTARPRRRAGRALLGGRSACHAHAERRAAVGACRRPARRFGKPRARQASQAPTCNLLTDMIACPGGDFCALANARSIPVAAGYHRALSGSGRTRRHRRHRSAHQRLHQLVRPSP